LINGKRSFVENTMWNRRLVYVCGILLSPASRASGFVDSRFPYRGGMGCMLLPASPALSAFEKLPIPKRHGLHALGPLHGLSGIHIFISSITARSLSCVVLVTGTSGSLRFSSSRPISFITNLHGAGDDSMKFASISGRSW